VSFLPFSEQFFFSLFSCLSASFSMRRKAIEGKDEKYQDFSSFKLRGLLSFLIEETYVCILHESVIRVICVTLNNIKN
jgi:threonine dehydratase